MQKPLYMSIIGRFAYKTNLVAISLLFKRNEKFARGLVVFFFETAVECSKAVESVFETKFGNALFARACFGYYFF